MKIIKATTENASLVIRETLKYLRDGGLVIFPSDTVYGALVDSTNKQAVKKLIEFKARPPGKPISVFVSDFKMLERLVRVDNQPHSAEASRGKQLAILKQILPGPFTVILKSKHQTNKLLESEKGTLGVRIPLHQLINQLSQRFGKPVTATSANLSGYPPHYSIDSLLNRLPNAKKKLIDLIVDAGKLPRNKPSTIVDLTQPQLKILRQGEVIYKDQRTYLSKTPSQTKKIAQFLLSKFLKDRITKPLIFIIEGELGVGKTIFVKGIGEFLGINNIVSPSFVIYYEYPVKTQFINELIHIDLYNIEEKEEFKYLGIDNYLKPKKLLCIEWGEKAGEIFDQLKSKGEVVYVRMKYVNEREREIKLNF